MNVKNDYDFFSINCEHNFRIYYYKQQAFCLIDIFEFLLEIIVLIKIIWFKNQIMLYKQFINRI